MAITQAAKTIKLTAINESLVFAQPVRIVAMTIIVLGGTVGNRIQVRDGAPVGSGNVIADWIVDVANTNGDLWGAKPSKIVNAISIDNNAFATGTFELTVFVE